jgi:hypothetical protein
MKMGPDTLKTHSRGFFGAQTVGVGEVADEVRLVSSLDNKSGFFCKEKGRVEPAHNSYPPEKVLTMSPEYTVF